MVKTQARQKLNVSDSRHVKLNPILEPWVVRAILEE